MAWVDVDQLSPDWLKMKVGCASASHMWEITDFLKPKKGETERQESSYRRKYKMAKVIEELTGMAQESYVTPAMEHGIDTEPLARAAYEMANDVEVSPGGIFFHDEIKRYCASPDGLIGSEGLLELKCLTTSAHLEILMTGEIPEEYRLQMDAQLSCAPERRYVDFGSYDNRIQAKHLQFWQKRYPRDEVRIKIVQDEVCTFLPRGDRTNQFIGGQAMFGDFSGRLIEECTELVAASEKRVTLTQAVRFLAPDVPELDCDDFWVERD